jgi:hypothetical protein
LYFCTSDIIFESTIDKYLSFDVDEYYRADHLFKFSNLNNNENVGFNQIHISFILFKSI